MTLAELKAYRQALRSKLDELERIRPDCLSCQHFAHAPRCDKFGSDVPSEFSRTPDSCPEWQYDGIPF